MNGTVIVIIASILYIIVLYLIVKYDITAHTKQYEGLYIFLAMIGFLYYQCYIFGIVHKVY